MTNVKDLLLGEDFVSAKRTSLDKGIDRILSGDQDQILDFFSNYIHWNGVFAGCVVNLASRFHLGLNYGIYEPGTTEDIFFKTMGHKVAGLIFAAAEDEYADENCKDEDQRIEHKTMAWFTLNKMYEFYDADISSRKLHPMMNSVLTEVRMSYGVQQESEFLDLVRQLGFHIGSEKVASYEFGILADKMKETHPALTAWMEAQEMTEGINAFSWVEVHGPVEDAHANYAIDAAQMIVDYVGSRDYELCELVMRELKAGFKDFSDHQDFFFNNYITSLSKQNA